MPEKCDENIKVVIQLDEAICEFTGKNLREVINLIENSIQHIPKLDEVATNFISKYEATIEKKYRDI